MSMTSPKRQAPKKRTLFNELKVFKDALSTLHPRVKKIDPSLVSSGKDIMLFPGLGVDGRFFKPMNRYLTQHGHRIHDWGLGVNDAGLNREFSQDDITINWHPDVSMRAKPLHKNELGVAYLCSRAVDNAKALADRLGHPIAVIGWSLGGFIAREVARALPEHIEQVITFGSPIVGGPKFTAVAWRFEMLNVDVDWIAEEVKKLDATPIKQSITSIYSKNDGIVHWSASIDELNPQVKHVEVKACHLGMGFSFEVWREVLKSLKSL
ncbi:esterase/lipase family protein [Ningiella sp. W23]|uniref:esterase/lipase family protein n=1 Tax=Ningiella sp. W23 TaxID=3023715 RepID=UPI0037584977